MSHGRSEKPQAWSLAMRNGYKAHTTSRSHFNAEDVMNIGHLLREFPLNKKQEMENAKPQQDEDGFVKTNHKSRGNKRQVKAPT
jgi:hypothetical protein